MPVQDTALEHTTVSIRRFRMEDVPHLFTAIRESSPELCRWMTWCRSDYSLEDTAAFVARRDAQWQLGEEYSFVIYDLENDDLLGSAGLSRVDQIHRFANLGYWVRSGRTGRGIASAAVRMVGEFALKELGLNRVEIIVPSENLASIRVAEKVGAKLEGVLMRRIVLGRRPQDALSYSLTQDGEALHQILNR